LPLACYPVLAVASNRTLAFVLAATPDSGKDAAWDGQEADGPSLLFGHVKAISSCRKLAICIKFIIAVRFRRVNHELHGRMQFFDIGLFSLCPWKRLARISFNRQSGSIMKKMLFISLIIILRSEKSI
tara:strand:+ start:80 stop:463 length:384 start_codon:yes stop_codon:yes gene_type:complete